MLKTLSFQEAKSLAFTGDMHGEFTTIVHKLNNYTDTVLIACGDIGMGFHQDEYYYLWFKAFNNQLARCNNHLVMFRGNHDDPAYFNGDFKKYSHLHIVPDYTVVSALSVNVLCVGGAVSIDRYLRINEEWQSGDKTYWGLEELPYYDGNKLDEINQQYPNNIQIVATHTCPSFAYPRIKRNIQSWLLYDPALIELLFQERDVMDRILSHLQPMQANLSHWYYGHFHEHHVEQCSGINFCLCNCREFYEFRD